VRPARRADHSAVLVVPIDTVRMEADFISFLCLRDKLRGISKLLNVMPSKVTYLLLRRKHV
jgi:hypothetical protein